MRPVVVNPYAKKKKSYAVFNPNQRRTGMPEEGKKNKKSPVVVHDRRQIGYSKAKGELVNEWTATTIWQLPDGKSLVPVVPVTSTGLRWKVANGTEASSVGKVDLKRVLLELHLMGFWTGGGKTYFLNFGQGGSHYTCRDNKKAFHHCMHVLRNVVSRDEAFEDFIKVPATMETIQEEQFNNKWDCIIKCMHKMVVEGYKIGPAESAGIPVASTPYSIGTRVSLYTAAVKKANRCLDLVVDPGTEVKNWNTRPKGQRWIFEFTKNN